MTLSIVSIEAAGRDRRARRLTFSDQTHQHTAAVVVRELGLCEGMAVDSASLAQQLAGAEASCARDRALRLVGCRERSVAWLRRRLVDDGYPLPLVEELVGRLAELALVDDERFSQAVVRSRTRSGFGIARIRADLQRAGVDEAIVESALAESDQSDQAELARVALGSRGIETVRDRERAIRRLTARGFPLQAAIAAVKSSSWSEDD